MDSKYIESWVEHRSTLNISKIYKVTTRFTRIKIERNIFLFKDIILP